MDMTMAAVCISLAACVVSVLGLGLKYDRRTQEEALWRGEVNGKLDVACGVRKDVELLKAECQKNAKDIAVVEASARSAHHRLDALSQSGQRPKKERQE